MEMFDLRDVIVVLPGILGSALTKDGVDLWAVTWGSVYRGVTRGALGEHLPLKLHAGAEDPLDGVEATGLIVRPSIIPRFGKTDGYGVLRSMITSAFRVKPEDASTPGNYYEFAYDWRLDNRVTARRLRALVGRVLPAWREFSGHRDAKVILIGHSMGGLVARYYTEVLGGWRDCRALITLGTPHRGSVNAIDTLANGVWWPLGGLTDVVRSFPSVYQLLPIYEVLESGGGRARVAEMTGMPGIDPGMAEDALRFHREIQEAVEGNKAEAAYREGFRTIPFVGTDQPTALWSSLEAGRIVVRRDVPAWLDPLLGGGDGTVPRISATPIELSGDAREYFLPEHHGVLQSNPHLLDSLRNLLEQLQSRGLGAIRGPSTISGAPGTSAISLDLEDAYPFGPPVEIRARLRDGVAGADPLEGSITPVDPPGPEVSGLLVDEGPDQVWRVEGLPPGLYRARVRPIRGGQGAPTAVHDLFAVIREGEPGA